MASLLAEFRGEINLIYADPPFNVGANFEMKVPIGEGSEKVDKDQSALEAVAYCDIWGKGTDSYLHFMYERLTLMRDLLAEDGSIYLHCDPTMSHYLKLLMDEVFGVDGFQNEVVWYYKNASRGKTQFAKAHDVILWYTKSPDRYTFNRDEILAPFESGMTEWRYRRGGQAGREMPRGKTPDDVIILTSLNAMDKERYGYPTQKPQKLLEYIITASSKEGDMVLDPFCGTGTTAAAAEKLGRKWITSDLGRYAIHTTRKRMIDLQRELHVSEKPYRSFDVYNVGRYERQWWQKEHLRGAESEHRRVVLELFGAEVLSSHSQP
ncbi:MAG: site-specific DNA-methyltransferase, partial [Proteobacteria bacterium]|nr:site-specific DNA-methyltransferase [Pseudomonadota bacterium]